MLRTSQRWRTALRAEVHYDDRLVTPGMNVGWFMVIYENHYLEPSLAENCRHVEDFTALEELRLARWVIVTKSNSEQLLRMPIVAAGLDRGCARSKWEPIGTAVAVAKPARPRRF